MIEKLTQTLDFNSQALLLRARRQETLASNIANADTPNFKARDFNFASALKIAAMLTPGSSAVKLTATVAGHFDGGQLGDIQARMQYRPSVQPSIDGNTVDMDTERAQFADNAMRYEAALRFLNGQIKTILSAVQTS